MAKDSSMDMKFSMRFQTLFEGAQTLSEGKLADDFESNLLIRRARLKFDGYVLSPRVAYKVELGLSNRDIGLGKSGSENTHFNAASNIILDAVLKWNFAKNTELWIGQTKLPSNRERVISSQQLQLVDRSIVNNRFNLDRDVGIQLRHGFSLGKAKFQEALAVSMGEGRNITSSNDDGFSYVGRIEFLPMGSFTDKGDYFGADLAREPQPKLSIGVNYEFNDDAKRSGGQLGSFMAESRDLKSLHADLMFKWKGFSFMSEYCERSTDDPLVSYDSLTNKYSAFYTGNGVNVQAGYLLKNNLEFSARYSTTTPAANIGQVKENQYTLGVSKYIVGHNLKIQSDFSLLEQENSDDLGLMFRFQVEMAL
ncbi:MAG TPA: porin [Bacteroidia bacterium]|nr:porin [Bacteroidia bacterium]